MACWSQDLSYLKYLIYSAAFNDPTAEPSGSIHAEFFRGWHRTFRIMWYDKHQPSNRRVLPKDYDNYIGGSDGEHQPVLRIYHDDDAEPPQGDSQRGPGDGGVGN